MAPERATGEGGRGQLQKGSPKVAQGDRCGEVGRRDMVPSGPDK